MCQISRAILPEPAERIRLRKSFHVTRRILAASIGVSQATIERWELGINEPTGENRDDYAAILAAWTQTERK